MVGSGATLSPPVSVSDITLLIVVSSGAPAEARWFTREELLAVLAHTDGTRISRQEHRELAAAAENSNPNKNPDAATADARGAKSSVAPVLSDSAPPFKIPPRTAIGGVILSEWAYGRAGPQPVTPKLGNL